MRRIKKAGILASAIVLAMGIFSGCDKKIDKKPDIEGKSITITFWEQDDPKAQKTIDLLIEDFQDKNPGITIERTHVESEYIKKNYTASSLGKKGPDIVLGPNDNLELFLSRNLLVPAADIVGEDFFSKLDSNSLKAARYNEKQYMIPDRWGNELLLIYNKKFVAQPPKTFEALLDIGKKLKADGKVQYGLVFNQEDPIFTIPFLSAFGGSVFEEGNTANPKVTLNTTAVKEWMTFVKGLQDDGAVPKDINYDFANNLFIEGKVPFIINGPWSFDEYKKANLDFGITAIPSINGKNCLPYSTVKGYTVSASVLKNNDKKDAVKKFLTYILDKESQLKMVEIHGQFPTNLDAIKDSAIQSNPILVNQKEALEKSVPMPIFLQAKGVWESISAIQKEVLTGKTKPEGAPVKMQRKAEEAIKSSAAK